MTVEYSSDVITSSFSCFLKLLFRWRGSIYKLVWRDFMIFAALFYLLSFIYRFALNDAGRGVFEQIAVYCETYNNLIPVAFVLGFYVSLVVNRFWEQLNVLPWPHRLAMFTSSLVQGHDKRGRLLRRTILRYANLAYVLTMRSICFPIKKRFPTLNVITESGIMLVNEQEVLENMSSANTNLYFVPLVWAASLVNRARKEGRIKDDFSVKTLIDEINDFRGRCGSLFLYDWITVPIVYTQVVTLAVYTFFLSCLMGRQFLAGHAGDMFFPLFTFLQFFFYMGWLKVAESLLNPFGEDDDDFEINGLIDSNLQISYLIVDDMYEKLPEVLEDKFWDTMDVVIPYTKEAEPFHKKPFHGSAANVEIPKKKQTSVAGSVLVSSSIPEENEFPGPADQSEVSAGRPFISRRQNAMHGAPGIRRFFRSFSRGSQQSTGTDAEGGHSSPRLIKSTPPTARHNDWPSSAKSFQDEAIFEMQDVDAGSMLLPVIEEDSFNSNSPTDITTQHKPDLHVGESIAAGPSDQQERELPHEENRPVTGVRPAYSDQVQEDLRLIRECSTQSQQDVSNKEHRI